MQNELNNSEVSNSEMVVYESNNKAAISTQLQFAKIALDQIEGVIEIFKVNDEMCYEISQLEGAENFMDALSVAALIEENEERVAELARLKEKTEIQIVIRELQDQVILANRRLRVCGWKDSSFKKRNFETTVDVEYEVEVKHKTGWRKKDVVYETKTQIREEEQTISVPSVHLCEELYLCADNQIRFSKDDKKLEDFPWREPKKVGHTLDETILKLSEDKSKHSNRDECFDIERRLSKPERSPLVVSSRGNPGLLTEKKCNNIKSYKNINIHNCEKQGLFHHEKFVGCDDCPEYATATEIDTLTKKTYKVSSILEALRGIASDVILSLEEMEVIRNEITDNLLPLEILKTDLVVDKKIELTLGENV